jgi:predicted RNase H-like HicB family nuclease
MRIIKGIHVHTEYKNGEWLAYTTKEPYVCMSDETEELAIEKAERAIDYYFNIIRNLKHGT